MSGSAVVPLFAAQSRPVEPAGGRLPLERAVGERRPAAVEKSVVPHPGPV